MNSEIQSEFIKKRAGYRLSLFKFEKAADDADLHILKEVCGQCIRKEYFPDYHEPVLRVEK